MIKEDFKKYYITNYTPEEVEATGAKLKDVQPQTMIAIQAFRTALNRKVKLIVNGMTTGKHKAPEHPGGLAVDCMLDEKDGPVAINTLVEAALNAGFKGIGIYWNGVVFSFHFDLRKEYQLWYGSKPKPGVGDWTYRDLFAKP